MTIKHHHTLSWRREGDLEGRVSVVDVEGSYETNLVEEIPAEAANAEMAYHLDADTCTSLRIESTVNCTIYTNEASTGSPDDTIAIEAGKPLVWYEGCGLPFPLSEDVDSVFVSTASATAGVLRIFALQDAMP